MNDSKSIPFAEADWLRLVRYFEGDFTPDETQAMEHWLADRPNQAELFSRLREEWDGAALVAGAAHWDVDTAAQRMLARAAATRSEKRRSEGPSRRFGTSVENQGWWGKRTLRQGMLLAGMTALALSMFFLTRKVPKPRPDAQVYATTAHQQAVIELADGTRVTLSPQTRLRLQQFGTQSRTVILDSGEAYFEVARATGSPFDVRSGSVMTQVLGTAFLVRYHANDAHVRIAVDEGKVRVNIPDRRSSAITLTPGQVGDVVDSVVRVDVVSDLTPGVERTPGRLLFHDTPVAAVLQVLTQRYGYQFRCTDRSLVKRPVTMMISTQSSSEALATIEHVLAVNLTVVGDTITLTPQPASALHGTPRVRTYDVWTAKSEVGR